MTMRILIRFTVLLFALALPFSSVEAKPLFLCDDGTTVLLTDQEGVNCPNFSSTAGELIYVPDGSTWRDVKWAVSTQRPEAIEPRPAGFSTQPVDACMQWKDLNLRTDGGLNMESTEDTQRWLALSRIVTATNLCSEYITRPIYPNF